MAGIDHFGFIAGAYAAAAVIVAVLVAWVMLDYRVQRRSLADLERRGIARRSAAAPVRTEPTAKEAG